jgi:hypothetical protein
MYIKHNRLSEALETAIRIIQETRYIPYNILEILEQNETFRKEPLFKQYQLEMANYQAEIIFRQEQAS